MASVQIRYQGNKELESMLAKVEPLLQYQAEDKASQAMANVVLRRAREIVPRSERNPNRPDLKRSKKQRASANWDIRLHTTLRAQLRRNNRGSVAVVGPKWPDGNKANLYANKKKSRSLVYWGVKQGRVLRYARNWMVQAADETRAEQNAASKAVVEQFLKASFGG